MNQAEKVQIQAILTELTNAIEALQSDKTLQIEVEALKTRVSDMERAWKPRPTLSIPKK